MGIIIRLLPAMAAGVIALHLTGCSAETGWRVQFGVAPVKAIHETQSTQQVEKKERY